MSWYCDKMVLGGPNTVVLVDESFLTRRKHNKGGFQGRRTKGHTTVIFAAVEMSVSADGTHKETGRAVLKVVPNKEAETLAKIMKRHIKPGSQPECANCVCGCVVFVGLGQTATH